MHKYFMTINFDNKWLEYYNNRFFSFLYFFILAF
jgi:hypothetical protein